MCHFRGFMRSYYMFSCIFPPRQCRAACREEPQVDPVGSSDSNNNTNNNNNKVSGRLPLTRGNEELFFDAEQNCQLPPDAGPCDKSLPRYFQSGGQCLSFSYGGCAGNQNNFFSREDCESKCLMRPLVEKVDLGGEKEEVPPLLLLPDSCGLPPDPGQCKDRLRRFYYNTFSKRCEEFQFGGCGGNDNNFAKLSKCKKKCGGA